MIKMVRVIAMLIFALSALCFGQSQEKLIFGFGSFPNDGRSPNGGLLFDKQGNIYGTTQYGGANLNAGNVYELSPQAGGSWSETILYNFCSVTNCVDGGHPKAGLVSDASGNLYGTTYDGGSGYPTPLGVVFELSPPAGGGAWTYTVLYNFGTTQTDGANPAGRLTWDSAGNLYGTTDNTVFEMTPDEGGSWSLTTLSTFCQGNQDCPNGLDALAGVSFDKAGNLYGTTYYGGFVDQWGVLYKLSPSMSGSNWTETLVDTFLPAGGARPMSAVNFDAAGNLYVTTSTGKGSGFCGGVDRYSATTGRRQTYLFSLHGNGAYGCNPEAGVAVNPTTEVVYGTSFDGGSLGFGNVYKIAGGRAASLYDFCQLDACADGSNPQSSLTVDSHGNLYGTTSQGGVNGLSGVVFEITP